MALTGEDPPSNELVELSQKKGINLIHYPLIKTIPLKEVYIPKKKYDFLIITSAKAVRHFLMKDNSISRDIPVLTTGEKTKRALRDAGFKNVIIAGSKGVDSIKEYILKNGLLEKSFLFLRAKKGKQIKLPYIDIVPVYETVFNHPKNFPLEGVDAIVFSSPSTFQSFKSLLKDRTKEVLKSLKVIAIGQTTKREIEKEGIKVDFTPTKPSLLEIIMQL